MIEREDILIGRVADRTANLDDWNDFEDRATEDADLWRRLGSAMKDDDRLRLAVGPTLDLALETQLPMSGAARTSRFRNVGLRVAALFIAAWVGWNFGHRSSDDSTRFPSGSDGDRNRKTASAGTAADTTTSIISASSASTSTATAANVPPVAAGIVLRELPGVVVEQKPVTGEGGGFEVVFIRRTLERRVVREAFRVGRDEVGRPVAVPTSWVPPQGVTSF